MAAHVSSSTIVAEAVSGSHVIKIDGYSRIKGLIENGKCVTSIPFSVGGNSWIIRFYPNGDAKDNEDYLSFYLCLDSTCAKGVKATVSFKLVDNDKNGGPVTLYSRTSPAVRTFNSKGPAWGFTKFMKKIDLEGSGHLRDDSFDIKCEITVMKDVCSKETNNKAKQFVVVPPGDLHHHLGKLLVNMYGTDVTFDVGQETFLAHRCILAARSSVFKAEFFGTMNTKAHETVKIEDMEADVFRLLLHFIYTDSLPDASQDVVMAQHLLVAADRYNVDRLKLICEEKLSKNLDSDILATSLALAEQHGCHGLKEACFDFLASPSNLERVMTSDGYEHLKSSCPFVLVEFMARCLPPEMKAPASSVSKETIA
ncbi:hypothetical protein GUJ93_ZPchr0013g35906 [Zizania palustris]|uniref:Speckle-type POZ protein n=1 Tax=Zizania palustris TaxID=103762 RepID=A0A8J5X1T8_ZIZPA|nr:hypothetical protein GUJ93_ZPchr0013g35906 [Zizania palustris]KAG8099841.1 hypothetical protein GUJ93_ZPchr0013g35906 [Zizania palustris]